MRYRIGSSTKRERRIFPIGAESHTGIVRARKPNEDAHLQTTVVRHLPTDETTQLVGLFLVADGMGGYCNGNYASTMIVKTVYALISADLENPRLESDALQQKFIWAV